MADISKYLHEHEQRQRAKKEAQKGKAEKAKKTGGRKPASRGELIQLIQRAELASIRAGQDGQIWFNPKNGEIWITHFLPSDNYLPSAAAEKYVLLWQTYPKKLEDVVDMNGAKIEDEQETEFYLKLLSEYARGKFSHKFDPAGIADRLIEQKIKPAFSPPIKEKPADSETPGSRLLDGWAAFFKLCESMTAADINEAQALLEERGNEGWGDVSKEDMLKMIAQARENV